MRFSKLLSGISEVWKRARPGTERSVVQIHQPRPLSLSDRRTFLRYLGFAGVGATVAYSFPSIIVPQNIVTPESAPELFAALPIQFNAAALSEAQRRFIRASIAMMHRQESDLLKRLEGETDLVRVFKGRRIPYAWSGVPPLNELELV